MRLTPSRFRSSSDVPGENRSGDSDHTSGVTMVFEPGGDLSASNAEDDGRAEEFVPESDAALLTVLKGMNSPVTVDEVVDELVEPARPSIETWATVHEQLHQDRLPALEATGAIEFDEAQGLVERSPSRSGGDRRFSAAVLTAIGAVLLFVGFVSVSVLVA